LIGENGLLKQLTKRLLERAMAAELTEHVGAAAKLPYLALRNIAKKWTRKPVLDWAAALNRFGILYEGRLPAD
jgi:transposase-like protein